MSLQPEHYAAMPYAVSAFFVFGLAIGWFKTRLLGIMLVCVFATAAQAVDVHRHYEVIKNTNADSRSYRVSMFDQEVTSETPTGNYEIAAGTRTWTLASTGHRALQAQIKHLASGTVLWTGPVVSTNGNTGLPGSAGIIATYNLDYPALTHTTSGNWTWNVRIWQSGTGAWGSYSSYNPQFVPTPEMTPASSVRGALISQWPFELAAHASLTLDLVHPTPFFVVIEELKQFATADGGFSFGYEAVYDDIPSTEHVAATADPEYALDPGAPEYVPDELPAPAARPATVTSTQELNDAQEARSTDEKALLTQIRDAQAAGINTTSAGLTAIKQALEGTDPDAGPGAAADDTDLEAAMTEETSRVAEMTAALGDLQSTLMGMIGKYDVNITGSDYPSLGIQLPEQLGGDFVAFDLETYAWLWNILRFAMLCGIGWYALNEGIEIVRGALA